jgi:hypothetical protein
MVAAIILGESAIGGLAQRIFALLAAAWVAVLAGWLLRLLAGHKGDRTGRLGPGQRPQISAIGGVRTWLPFKSRASDEGGPRLG